MTYGGTTYGETPFGSASVSGDVIITGSVTLSGSGDLIATGTIKEIVQGTVNISGSGDLTTTGTIINIVYGTANLSGGGDLTANGIIVLGQNKYKIITKSNGDIIADYNLRRAEARQVGNTVQLRLYSPDNLSQLLDYGEWAGKYNTSTMIDGTRKYKDRIPSGDNIDTLLVGVEVGATLDDKDVTEFWGLIDNVEDDRDATLGTDIVELGIFMLADFEDYADHSAVESDLKLG